MRKKGVIPGRCSFGWRIGMTVSLSRSFLSDLFVYRCRLCEGERSSKMQFILIFIIFNLLIQGYLFLRCVLYLNLEMSLVPPHT